MTNLSPEGEIALLILASHGGVMDRAEAEAEFHRVMALSPEDRATWRREAIDKVRVFRDLRLAIDAEGDR